MVKQIVRHSYVLENDGSYEFGPDIIMHSLLEEDTPEYWIAKNTSPLYIRDEDGDLSTAIDIDTLKKFASRIAEEGKEIIWTKPKDRISVFVGDRDEINPVVYQWVESLKAQNTNEDGSINWDKVVSRIGTGGQFTMTTGKSKHWNPKNFRGIHMVPETKGITWVSESLAKCVVVWEDKKDFDGEWSSSEEVYLRTGHKLVNGPHIKSVVRVVDDEVIEKIAGKGVDMIVGEDNLKLSVTQDDLTIDWLWNIALKRVSEEPSLYCNSKSERFPLIWKVLLGIDEKFNRKSREETIKLSKVKTGKEYPEEFWYNIMKFGDDECDCPAWAQAIAMGVPPTDRIVRDKFESYIVHSFKESVNSIDDLEIGWATVVYSYKGELSSNEVGIPENLISKLKIKEGEDVVLIRSPMNGPHTALRVKAVPVYGDCLVVNEDHWDVCLGDADGDRGMITKDSRLVNKAMPVRTSLSIHEAAIRDQKEADKIHQTTPEDAVISILKSAAKIGPASNCFTAGVDEKLFGTNPTLEDYIEIAQEWIYVIQPYVDGLKHGESQAQLPMRASLLSGIKSCVTIKDIIDLTNNALLIDKGIINNQIKSWISISELNEVQNSWCDATYEWIRENLSQEEINIIENLNKKTRSAINIAGVTNNWDLDSIITNIGDESVPPLFVGLSLSLCISKGILMLIRIAPKVANAIIKNYQLNIVDDSEDDILAAIICEKAEESIEDNFWDAVLPPSRR